jgi:hypothetical protein
MTFKSILAAASTALLVTSGSAMAAAVGTFSGVFNVTAVNVTNLNSAESEARQSNFDLALAGNLGGADSDSVSSTFTYDGVLDFETRSGSSTTIAQFLDSGDGTLTGFDRLGFGALTNSKGSISSTPGTATTTFYLFEALAPGYSADVINIGHDDGVRVFADGVDIGGLFGPNSLRQTNVDFTGGKLAFLYVSTNSDPSIFKVDSDVSIVPLPAAGWMLLAGVAALGAAKRRRKAA